MSDIVVIRSFAPECFSQQPNRKFGKMYIQQLNHKTGNFKRHENIVNLTHTEW